MEFTSIEPGLAIPAMVLVEPQLSPQLWHAANLGGQTKCQGGKFCRSKPFSGKDYRGRRPAGSLPNAAQFLPPRIEPYPKLPPVLSNNLISDFQIQANMF